MIDGETGERTIDTLVKTQDEVRENTIRGLTYNTEICWGTPNLFGCSYYARHCKISHSQCNILCKGISETSVTIIKMCYVTIIK